jgi:hypothetical protein
MDFSEGSFANITEGREMTRTTRAIVITTGMTAFIAAASFVPVKAQREVQPQWYNLSTPKSGTCPGIDRHIVVDADRTIAGNLSWDHMRHTATLTPGTLKPDDTFELTASEVGGSKHATITGKVLNRGSEFTITGSGTGCDNQKFTVISSQSLQ